MPGAPPGGRVHWFLHWLSEDVRKYYRVSYDYSEHRYCLIRYEKAKIKSIFILCQTSKKTFRTMYHNLTSKKTLYVSFINAKSSAQWFNNFVKTEMQEEAEALNVEIKKAKFARNLKKYMRHYGIPQEALADFLGVKQQSISRYLNRKSIPSESKIRKLEKFFGVEQGGLYL